jgi:radical SAM superfamily enzyme YgiQ (UPF0313 family)
MAVEKGNFDVLYWRPTKCLNLHYELLPMDRYRAHNWHCMDGSARSPYASIYTSLGCPFDCYYCNIHTLYKGREMLFKNPASVIQEVDNLVYKYGVRNIKIWDELFALKESRVQQICQGLRPYDLNIWAYARVDTVTEKMLHEMKAGGINWVSYGFENATATVRHAANKDFPESKVEKAIKWTRGAGINIIANFTFGLPGETKQTAEATLAFAKYHLFEWCNFYTALPYPGSQWYRDTMPDMKPEDFNQYGSFKSEWTVFRDKAFKSYFRDHAYLDMVTRKFGDKGFQIVTDMVNYRRR